MLSLEAAWQACGIVSLTLRALRDLSHWTCLFGKRFLTMLRAWAGPFKRLFWASARGICSSGCQMLKRPKVAAHKKNVSGVTGTIGSIFQEVVTIMACRVKSSATRDPGVLG